MPQSNKQLVHCGLEVVGLVLSKNLRTAQQYGD